MHTLTLPRYEAVTSSVAKPFEDIIDNVEGDELIAEDDGQAIGTISDDDVATGGYVVSNSDL